MNRRDFCRSSALVPILSLASFPEQDRTGRTLSTTSTRSLPAVKKMLFFDLGKLDYWDNCELRQGRPEFVAEATYEDKSVANQGAGKPNVYYDQQNRLWRMLYNIGWGPVGLMSAISEDGILWRPDPHPKIQFSEEAGGRIADHHIYNLPDAAAGGIYHDPIAEDGFPFKLYVQISGKQVLERALKDKNHALHQMAAEDANPRTFHEGRIAVSKDGLNWQLHPEYKWSRPDWQPEPPYFGFYQRETRRHAMLVRAGWGDRRIAMQTTTDFKSWSEPELLLQMDPLDQDPVGFYAMPVISCGDMYVGLLWIFHNSSSRPVNSFNQFFGTMDAQLTYSYDGRRFIRGFREPFLPLNPYPVYGCTQLRPYSIIDTGTEIRIYSGSSRAPHGLEGPFQKDGKHTNAIVMHRLRMDGWMYMASKGHWARFQTKPIGVWSDQIFLNAAAPYGHIRYQVTDEKSQPVEGFTFEDCLEMKYEDQISWPLKWQNSNAEQLKGKVIRLEFEFYNANIYSISTAFHMLDAQDHWLMKEGRMIDPTRFDY